MNAIAWTWVPTILNCSNHNWIKATFQARCELQFTKNHGSSNKDKYRELVKSFLSVKKKKKVLQMSLQNCDTKKKNIWNNYIKEL